MQKIVRVVKIVKMVNVILTLSLLTSVVHTARGQSKAGENSDCVYTFKVTKSECGQTPGPNVDDQIWKNSVIGLQAQVKQMASDMRVMRENNNKLVSDVRKLQTKLTTVTTDPDNQQSSTGGAVYMRWGRTTCQGNGTTLVYAGVAGGSFYDHSGGGADYLCLPRDPEWGDKLTAGFRRYNSFLYGAEYALEDGNGHFSTQNAQSLHDNNVPCAVCRVTNRPSTLMIPAKLSCPDSWTKEYSGYLMTEHYGHKGRTSHVCMDNAPEVVEGGAADQDGVLFYSVEAKCGSLPCPKYKDGWDITCVVCSK